MRPIMYGEKWTAAEDAWLHENYLTAPPDDWVRALKRTPLAVRRRANQIGLKRASHRPPKPPSAALCSDVWANWAHSTIAEIAQRHGVSRHTVCQARQRLGVRKFVRRHPRLVSLIRQMAKHHSYNTVAKMAGVSRGCVAGVLRDYGVAS